MRDSIDQSRRTSILGVLVICLGLVFPNLAIAQSQSATPIAPDAVEGDLGVQSVAFATFDQSFITMIPGGSVTLTLTVTSTATSTIEGAISIPAVAGLTFSAPGAARTENMATCVTSQDGSGGISGSYSLVTGSGTCAVTFTAQLAGTAAGTLVIGAQVSENGSLASSPSTTISVVTPSVSAAFTKDAYSVDEGIPAHITLIISMVGPATNGGVSIPVPASFTDPTISNVSAIIEHNASGSCSASTDGSVISGTFSESADAAPNTCTIAFDITVPNSGLGTFNATVTADGSVNVVAQAGLSITPIGPPLFSFDQATYVIPENGSVDGSVSIRLDAPGTRVATITSPVASITDPEIASDGLAITCTAVESGTGIEITITQEDVQAPCVIIFTIEVNPGTSIGPYTNGLVATWNSDPWTFANLNVVGPPAPGMTASFDQAIYSVTAGEPVTMTLNINVPQSQLAAFGSVTVSPPATLGAAVFTSATAAPVDVFAGNCKAKSGPTVNISFASFSPLTPAFTCSVTMTLSVAPTTFSSSGSVTTAFDVTFDSQPVPPTALVVLVSQPAMSISLDPPTALPGDDVTVSVMQQERFPVIGPGSMTVVLPPGVAFNDAVSPTMTCAPIANCLTTSASPGVSGGAIGGTYTPDTGGAVTTTLQFVVTVTAPIGSAIDFSALGMLSDWSQTSAGPVTLHVQDEELVASDFDLVVEAGGSVTGSIDNHLSGANNITHYESTAQSGDGTFSLDTETGDFTYNASTTTGTATIAYVVTDATNLTAGGTITITIIEPLETPDLTLQMLSGETISFDLTSIVSGGQPPHAFTPVSTTLSQGTIDIGESGLLSFTANSDASGSETFSYEVTDGLGLPAAQVTSAAVSTGVVTISIVQPLVINPVALTAVPGTTQTFDLNLAISGGLPPFSFVLLTQPAQGSASITPDGMLTFTANAEATGTDTLSFQVTDRFEESGVSSSATIPGTIDVTYVEVLPTATATALGPLPPNPNATSTATRTPEGNAQSPTAASGGGVTQLPSTGSGDSDQASAILLAMLAFVILCLAGLSLRRFRHSR